MRIFDCFTFLNELDLLEFRLRLMNDQVDYFVIAESNLTFTGQPKPYNFQDNQERFAPWIHKIIYIPDAPSIQGLVFEKDNSYNPKSAASVLENRQRMALLSLAGKIADDDLVLVSDLDEIPDPSMLPNLIINESPKAFSQLFHYYFLNCQQAGTDRWWNGTVAASGRQFKETGPQHMRDNRNNYPRIKKGGWHFSYLGGLEQIRYKILSFAHTEFNSEKYYSDENILKALKEGKDLFDRPGMKCRFVSVYYYPARIRKIMLSYPYFLNPRSNNSLWQKIYYSAKRLFT